ncbi:glycosyl hydrolase-related protein [Neobacillus pocheonensis]|uniref:Glycosyl hydrolase-related protein n=1 Tax=Neobacillus pocheonensis TaxID=363869 RepID=A0ABT0WHU6_9BACI|nr:glycosyl hydrolase-related protein [Neobacillus pocheonensis]
MAISALKKSENDSSLLVRIYNTTNQPIDAAKVEINQEFFKSIKLVDLNEVPITDVDERILFIDNEIQLKDIRANEILSFKLA